MPTPRTPHLLREIDRDARTAVCDLCGPVSVFSRGQGRWRCAKAHADGKRASRQRHQTTARTALKVQTPCCNAPRTIGPLKYPTAKIAQIEWLTVECRCATVYMVVRLHQPDELVELGSGATVRTGTGDTLLWTVRVQSFAEGEPDADVATEIDGQPSVAGAIDAPRVRDALLHYLAEDPKRPSWSSLEAWRDWTPSDDALAGATDTDNPS